MYVKNRTLVIVRNQIYKLDNMATKSYGINGFMDLSTVKNIPREYSNTGAFQLLATTTMLGMIRTENPEEELIDYCNSYFFVWF